MYTIPTLFACEKFHTSNIGFLLGFENDQRDALKQVVSRHSPKRTCNRLCSGKQSNLILDPLPCDVKPVTPFSITFSKPCTNCSNQTTGVRELNTYQFIKGETMQNPVLQCTFLRVIRGLSFKEFTPSLSYAHQVTQYVEQVVK